MLKAMFDGNQTLFKIIQHAWWPNECNMLDDVESTCCLTPFGQTFDQTIKCLSGCLLIVVKLLPDLILSPEKLLIHREHLHERT